MMVFRRPSQQGAAADVALGGDQLVIGVQTHDVSDRRIAREETATVILGLGESVAGGLFQGIDALVRIPNQAGYSFAEYLRCVFLERETAVAVLSSGPGAGEQDPRRMLNNAEMVGTRELTERLHGSGRLINHAVVHPNIPGELERMGRWLRMSLADMIFRGSLSAIRNCRWEPWSMNCPGSPTFWTGSTTRTPKGSSTSDIG
jgi:hypothetical protein